MCSEQPPKKGSEPRHWKYEADIRKTSLIQHTMSYFQRQRALPILIWWACCAQDPNTNETLIWVTFKVSFTGDSMTWCSFAFKHTQCSSHKSKCLSSEKWAAAASLGNLDTSGAFLMNRFLKRVSRPCPSAILEPRRPAFTHPNDATAFYYRDAD